MGNKWLYLPSISFSFRLNEIDTQTFSDSSSTEVENIEFTGAFDFFENSIRTKILKIHFYRIQEIGKEKLVWTIELYNPGMSVMSVMEGMSAFSTLRNPYFYKKYDSL